MGKMVLNLPEKGFTDGSSILPASTMSWYSNHGLDLAVGGYRCPKGQREVPAFDGGELGIDVSWMLVSVLVARATLLLEKYKCERQ